MVQRKDTPAARMALAKRRQRAAQNLNSSTSNNNSGDGNNGNASTTASAASNSTADDTNPRSVNRKNNNASSSSIAAPHPPVKEVVSAAPHWKGRPSNRRPSPKVVPSGRNAKSQQPETKPAKAAITSRDEDALEAQATHSEHIPRKGETTHKSGGGGGGGGHTVAGQTVDGTITTAALTASTMGHNRQEEEEELRKDSSGILDASLGKSKSFGSAAEESTVGEANIETVLREDGSGFEYVQEVEVRQHRRRHHNPGPDESEDVRERYEPISNFGYVEVTSPQPKSGHELRGDTMQPYYPQPRSPDATRQQQSATPSSHIARPPTDSRKPRSNRSPLRQRQRHQRQHTKGMSSGVSTQRTVSSTSTAREEQSTTSSSEVGRPAELPSLNQSSAIVRPDESQEGGVIVETSDMSYEDASIPSQRGPSEAAEEGNSFVVRSKARDVSNATGIPKLDSQQGRPPTSPVRPFQRPPSPSSRFTQHKETQRTIEKAASLKSAPSAASSTGSVDRLTVSTGGLAVMRKSRIPSPTPINPGGKRPLPQRSISSPKSNASPEKRPSPKRFNLPPTGRNASPPKQQLRRPQTNVATSSVATPTATVNLSIDPNHTSQRGSGRSRITPAFMTKRMGASDSTFATNAGASSPSVKTVHSPERKLASASNSTRSPSPKQSPRVDRVSSFLKDACNLKDNGQGNMHKQAQLQKAERLDPVLQSRTDVKYFDERHAVNKTVTVQRSTTSLSHEVVGESANDAVDDHLDSRVNTWSASKRDVASPIERYRAAADHYDHLQEQQRLQQERINQHPSQKQYRDPDQYQFQNPVANENFGPTTPKISKSQGERYRGAPKYSYESPNQTTATNNHRNIFQTPQTASPTRKQSLQSPAVVDDVINIADGDVHAADAASLCSGHRIVLRSCLSCTTIQAIQNDVIASMQGLDLGLEKELLEVVKIHQDGIATSTELKYGDIIILRSTAADGKAFGTRKRRRDIEGMDEFGFFDIGNIKSDRWMILPARPDKEIVIGRAALSTKNALHHTSDDRGIVQSGSPIILRNCYNGGILSVREGKLALLTDSYNRSRPGGPEGDTLLGRLQHHDKLSPSISESFQLVLPSVPPCPAWPLSNGIGERVFLTGSYLKKMERVDNGAKDSQPESLFSPRIKEAILIDEVIGSFLGLEGLHIRLTKEKGIQADEHQHAFHLVDAGGIIFDLSLRNLVEQILPLSTCYVRVRNFLASHYPGYEYGRVMQAFCEGLDSYLYQFASFVSDLEQKLRKQNGGSLLTMKGLHYEITPLLHSMSILDDVTEAVAATKGGALINTLWSLEKRVYMGDTVAKELIGTLLDKCSVPYVNMLTTWLQSGTLCDPYEEFMVFRPSVPIKRKGFDGDSWSSLFQVNEKHVIKDIIPNEKTKWKILVTGKYWNAVQACNVDVKTLQEASLAQPKITKFRFQSDSSAISTYIDTTYHCASTSLISLLKDKFKLIDSLQTVKRYFLLDQGDFFMNFLDTAEGELVKPVEDVSVGRVQHSLNMSIQLTEAQREGDIEYCSHFLDDNDRQIYPSALRCRFLGESLVAYLDSIYGGIGDLEPKTPSRQAYGAASGGDTGFDLFTIDFAMVPFPTSLILSGHSMESYKLLFRQLFFSKHVERRLVGVWSDHQMLKKLDSLRGLLGPSFLLRQRMLHFVQNLNNYMTFEVIESNWLEMMSAIDGPETSSSVQHEQTVDDLLEIHDSFIGKTLDACLLTNPSLIKSLTKLLKTCLLFTEQMKRFMDTTKIYDDSINLAAEKRGAVQRNLNERGSLQAAAVDKKKLRRALDAVKEEREMLHHRQTRRVGREVCSDSYKRMVHRFEEVFSADLALFMMQLNSHTASGMVANLGLRLDWNGFITSSIPVH